MKTQTELTKLITFKPINYKYIVDAHVIVYPLDRNGNTYHRVTICDQQGNEIADSGKTYGYGNHYEQTAKTMVLACIEIPVRYKKLGGKIDESRYDTGVVFRTMREDKFLKVNYIIKG